MYIFSKLAILTRRQVQNISDQLAILSQRKQTKLLFRKVENSCALDMIDL